MLKVAGGITRPFRVRAPVASTVGTLGGVAESFYVPLGGDRYESTKATVGPWSPDFQHGGPPCALLARAIEGWEPSAHQVAGAPGDETGAGRGRPAGELMLARFTAEFLGPVPVAELSVSAQVVRGGRRVQLVEAELVAGGRPVLRARGWRLRRDAALDLPDVNDQAPPPLSLEATGLVPGFEAGYAAAMEWRPAGGATGLPGPAAVWARQRVPLVAGEEPSGVQRVAAVADSGNGISWELDLDRWSFVNVDLTFHLVRPPAGEWICLDARTRIDPAGIGVATSALSDATGLLGRGAQSLLIAPR